MMKLGWTLATMKACSLSPTGRGARSLLAKRFNLTSSCLVPRLHRLARERKPHQDEGRGGFRAADQNACRRLHLVPLIGVIRPPPSAFAELADDALQGGRKRARLGGKMRKRDQRKGRVEHVHFARDHLIPDIGEHLFTDQRERTAAIE